MAVKKEKQPGKVTREPVNKTAREGTREPVNKEEQSQQQASNTRRITWKYNTWRKRNTVLQVRKQRQVGQQQQEVWPWRVERDCQHRPEGKLSQSEAEDFRAESIGPVNTESRGQKRQGEDVEELTTKGLNYQDGEVLIPIKSTWSNLGWCGWWQSRTQTSAESRASEMNADNRQTKRVNTDGVDGQNCMLGYLGRIIDDHGPMHEEMSFKIDMSRRSRSRIQKFQEEREIQKIEESLRPLCMVEDLKWWYVWRGIDWCTQNGDLGGCVQTVRHRRRRELIFCKWSSLKLWVQFLYTCQSVSRVGRNCQHRQITCWQAQQRTLYRSLVMKLEDVTQTNEEIDEAVHRSASAYRGAGSRRFSYFKS